jgi:hypothetical protein
MYHDSVSTPQIARLQASFSLINKLHPTLEILDLDQSFASMISIISPNVIAL